MDCKAKPPLPARNSLELRNYGGIQSHVDPVNPGQGQQQIQEKVDPKYSGPGLLADDVLPLGKDYAANEAPLWGDIGVSRPAGGAQLYAHARENQPGEGLGVTSMTVFVNGAVVGALGSDDPNCALIDIDTVGGMETEGPLPCAKLPHQPISVRVSAKTQRGQKFYEEQELDNSNGNCQFVPTRGGAKRLFNNFNTEGAMHFSEATTRDHTGGNAVITFSNIGTHAMSVQKPQSDLVVVTEAQGKRNHTRASFKQAPDRQWIATAPFDASSRNNDTTHRVSAGFANQKSELVVAGVVTDAALKPLTALEGLYRIPPAQQALMPSAFALTPTVALG